MRRQHDDLIEFALLVILVAASVALMLYGWLTSKP